MANTLTVAVPKIFAQGMLALRENAVTPRLVLTDFGSEVRQRGDTIDITIPSSLAVSDVTPSQVPPAPSNLSPTKVQIPLSYWKKVDFSLTDKEVGEIINGVRNQQVSEAVKALANFVDVTVLGLTASGTESVFGHVGTPGTTPFNTANDVTDATNARKLLNKQLAPMSPRFAILDPDAEANALGKQRAFQDASWRGDAEGIKLGQIGTKFGIDWWMNQNVQSFTFGTLSDGSGHKALINDAAVAIGQTSVNMDAVSLTGTVKIGDIFTVAGDTQQYVVTANATAAANAIAVSFAPGAKVAWADDAQATFVGAAGATEVRNIVAHRDAFALAVRPLSAAEGFTGGNEIMSEMDPVSGLSLRLEVSRQHKQTNFSFDILFGCKCIRPDLAVILAG